MHHFVAALDLSPDRTRAARVILPTLGQPAEGLDRPDGPSWLSAGSDRNVVATARHGSLRTAVFGTGLHLRFPDLPAAASAIGGDAAADDGAPGAVPDDSVAVLLDAAAGTLRAAVGAGWHRLFVAHPSDGGTLVSSNLGVLARLLGTDTGADRSHEDFLLGFGFLPDDLTVYRGIRVLRPGRYRWERSDPAPAEGAAVAAAPDGGGPSVESRSVESRTPTFTAAADELHDRFMEVMEELAGPSRRCAVMLGGFDSALVAAGLARLGREVTTYTFGFGDRRYEQRNVDLVTNAIGSTEQWVRITPEVIMSGLRDFGQVFAQPGPQPHYQIHTLHASRRIRDDGFDMVLTGDGCDAIFLGYPMVSTRARLLRALRRAPRPLVDLGLAATSTRPADRHLGHVARMVRSTLGNLQLPMPARGHLPTRYLDDVALERLRVGPPPPQYESVTAIRRRLAVGLDELDPVRLAFHGNAATGQSRVKVDGAVAATGLRQYSPFLHPKLRDFVSSLPIDYLRPPGTAAGSAGKAVLIEMIKRHSLLPDEVVDMPKQSPVDAPIDDWYTGPLRSDLLDLLGHLPFEWDAAVIDEVLRPKFAERQYRERVALGHHTFQAVGLLAAYASFHRR